MIIKISKEAKEYLKKNNKEVVTIDLHGTNCCVEMFLPTISTNYPKEQNKFDKFQVDDFEVFVYKGARAKKDTINITLSKFLIIKSLEVSGIEML